MKRLAAALALVVLAGCGSSGAYDNPTPVTTPAAVTTSPAPATGTTQWVNDPMGTGRCLLTDKGTSCWPVNRP